LKHVRTKPKNDFPDFLPVSVKIRNMNKFLPKLINGEENDKFCSSQEVDTKIQCTKNIKREHETFVLTPEDPEKLTLYTVGKKEGNNIRIKDEFIDDSACQIYYDPNLKGWFVVEKHPDSDQKKFSSGTFIYLKNFQQHVHNRIASIRYKLTDGMEVICNGHVFKVEIKE